MLVFTSCFHSNHYAKQLLVLSTSSPRDLKGALGCPSPGSQWPQDVSSSMQVVNTIAFSSVEVNFLKTHLRPWVMLLLGRWLASSACQGQHWCPSRIHLALSTCLLGGAKHPPFSKAGLLWGAWCSPSPVCWVSVMVVPAPRCVCNSVTFSLPLLPPSCLVLSPILGV